MFNFWRQIYLAQVQAYWYAVSDETSFMRCVPADALRVIPPIAGC